MAKPVCTECGKSLAHKPPGTKTCGTPKCRSRRARRMKRVKDERARNATLPEGMREVSQVVTSGVRDAAHEVMKEELRPLVREQMTEAVLQGIDRLINLTPTAIELLERHMQSGDETVAQRAVTLLLKYTLGNPSVAPPATTQNPSGLTVQFNLPRPGDAVAPEAAVVDSSAEETRNCMECKADKPLHEFVAGGPKCQACFDGMRGMLQERFGDEYAG